MFYHLIFSPVIKMIVIQVNSLTSYFVMRIPFTSEELNQISLIGSKNCILKRFYSLQWLNPQAGACKGSVLALSPISSIQMKLLLVSVILRKIFHKKNISIDSLAQLSDLGILVHFPGVLDA